MHDNYSNKVLKRQDRIKCVHHNLDLFEALNDSLDLVFVLQMQRE